MTTANDRTILHVDLNSFFARAQQQANPSLRNKPVGITKGPGRTCLIACSDEAKAQGVKTGMNIYEAKHLIPKLILVPADFNNYFALTKQFIAICQNYTDLVEVFSLDEVFLDVTYSHHLYGNPLFLAYHLQNQIKLTLGNYLTCSIGIAENKMLAKLASGLAPRQGVLVVTKDNKKSLLSQAPFSEVCGIGHQLSKRLYQMGISSLSQIASTPDQLLVAEFGPFWAPSLKRLARGEDSSLVVPASTLSHAKSVSRTFTLYQNTTNQNTIKALLQNLTEEAVFKLRQMHLLGRQFGLMVRGEDLSQSNYLTTRHFTSSGQEVFAYLTNLYRQLNWRHQVRFVGVWISLLQPENQVSSPLFLAEQKQIQLNKAVDKINHRHGNYSIHPANMLGSTIIMPEVNGYLGDKQFAFLETA